MDTSYRTPWGGALHRLSIALAAGGYSPATQKNYLGHLRRFAVFAEQRGVVPAGLTLELMREYLSSKTSLCTGSLSCDIVALWVFCRWARESHELAGTPDEFLRPPRVHRKIPRVLSDEEVGRLLAAAKGPRTRAAIEILYGSGLRAAELTRLNVADVSLTEGAARVTGKGGKERVAWLTRPAVEAITAWLAVRGLDHTPALFIGSDGHRLGTTWLRRTVKKAAARAQLGHVHPHLLRHAYATALLRGGADLRAIQELLGHASITTTMLYTYVSPEHLHDAHRRCHPRA